MISIALSLIFLLIFLTSKRNVQFYIFTLVVLFPFTFGNIKSVPNVQIIEWLNPVIFLIIINELVPVNRVRQSQQHISFRGLELFIFAFIVLITWTIISYINNQILIEKFFGGVVKTGISRTYFNIFNNVLLFFNTAVFIKLFYKEIDFEKWLNLLIYISLLIGFLRISAFVMKFDLPFFANLYNYGKGTQIYGGLAFRLGGLTEVAGFGIAALLAKHYLVKKINIYYLIIFILFVFFSGGRTFLVGLSLAIFIYSIFFAQRYIVYATLLLMLLVILVVILVPQEVLEGQLARMTAFKGGIKNQSIERFKVYQLYIRNFINNPIFGKGITPYTGFVESRSKDIIEFVRAQQFSGGHGSYLSILSTFGIGGILYLLIMVLGGIILAYRKVKKYFIDNSILAAISIFSFFLLLIKSIYYITGYNGLKDFSLFFLVGLVASIRVIENDYN